jgi:hypothetical protein
MSPLIARVCGCDYCTMKGAEYVSDPDSLVKFKINNPANYQIETQGTLTAEFHVCKKCGLVLVTSKIGDGLYSVLNAKTLGFSGYKIDPEVKDYSGETLAVRLSRRKTNWSKAERLT